MELPLGTTNTSELAGGVSPKEASLGIHQADLLDSPSDADTQGGKKSIIASLLAQSSRHLFGPTSAPSTPLKHQVVSIEGLISKLGYLKPEEIAQVKKAFQ